MREGDARGLSKVRAFLVNRQQVMQMLRIQEGDLIKSEDLGKSILCSNYLHDLVESWKNTWWPMRKDNVDANMFYEKGKNCPYS